ncbi:MAG: polyprenyl synthetase family protein [Microbacteriaceae bacterium]|nr:polyprenyl synthetase family protein [Microbacteriaceae bacterium]
MTTTDTLAELVRVRVQTFLDRVGMRAERVSPELSPVVRQARALLSSGKRLRPQFCYWGWLACDDGSSEATSRERLQTVLGLSVSLELFQASALVHDDLIDNSDTRRGMPSAHVAFADFHRDSAWDGDAAEYGRSAALLLGDLLLTWSTEAVTEALSSPGIADRVTAVQQLFDRMRQEVMLGQYLDLAAEHDWMRRPRGEASNRVEKIMLYKTARYTVVHPLLIGATVGGANTVQLRHLAEYGRTLGLAFQLRDDILGVFGDPQATGKPAGDDLREGKRTLLVALTREHVAASVRQAFDALLGSPELTEAQIETLRGTIRDSGALETCERLVSRWTAQAVAALHGGRLSAEAVTGLTALAHRIATRDR